MNIKELELLAEKNRKRLVEVVYAAKAGHIGGDLSCLNVMTALYFHVMKNLNPAEPKAAERDRFVLSKGHCVEALYVTLEAKGFLKPEVLDTLGKFGSRHRGELGCAGSRTGHRRRHGDCCQDGQEKLEDLRVDGRRRAGRRLYLRGSHGWS